MRRDAELTLIWLLSCVPHSMCHSLPGRPRLIKCQSPEKETFTCWWEPGSAGGLPINHHLYYRKESSVEVFECPDYHKAGNNSCYFDKRHTSIWIIYNITVVASNALGKAYSEPVEVDVMDIVQPHPPENVNVTLIQTENSPYFLVQWQPPHDVDTSSGWVTIKYEARIKLDNSGDEEDSQWELYSAGKQLDLSIYSPQPGGRYIVQVRCRLDHSLWSEWSPSAFIQIPDKASDTQMAVMILAVTLLGFIFLFTAGVLAVKMKHVKLFLLPPVPVPKISGLDTQLLKSGKSEEIYSALITQGYPQIAQSSDHQVEYIVVSDNDEEMEFNGRALLESQKGENCSTDPAEKIPKDSSQELNSIDIEQGSGPGSGDDIQNCIPECDTTFTKIHPGMISPQLGDPNTENDCNSMTRKVSITLTGLTGYVEVNEKEREQKPQVGEDYSMVSEVLRDNILVLEKDSTPILGHKVVNCEKSSKTQETGGEN